MSIDVGETNGCCFMEVVNGQITNCETKQINGFEIVDEIVEFKDDLDVIIVEDFRLRKKALIGDNLFPSQLIGAIKYILRGSDLEIVLQQPSQKEFFNNDRLKKLNLFDEGKPHARDAVRHSLYYCFFTKKVLNNNKLLV